ncbi:ankyrin repeat domain-containing protein [Aspergillus foveolatus]|uniref:ankyrin repeat domain-containing protein n=1 Tax=Aspergillus foveolatus TaxID=210207 RepID=UPI003CCCE61D
MRLHGFEKWVPDINPNYSLPASATGPQKLLIDSKYGDLVIQQVEEPLEKTAANCREDVVGILLQRYPTLEQLNVADRDQYTPLHHAVENGHYEIVVLLANSGRDIGINEQCSSNGRSYGLIKPRSPLCLATFHGHTAIAKCLLQCDGIYIEARGALLNGRKVIALQIATELGRQEIVDQISGYVGNVEFGYPTTPDPLAFAHDFSTLEDPDLLEDFDLDDTYPGL